MRKTKGRDPNLLKGIIKEMKNAGCLNVNFILALRKWRDALRRGEFGPNAQNEEEATLRAEILMEGVVPNPRGAAEKWVKDKVSFLEDPTTDPELELRARLLDEMRLCLSKGGVRLPSGQIEPDVPGIVEKVAYQLNPNLKEEVERELEMANEANERETPTIIEGTFRDVV